MTTDIIERKMKLKDFIDIKPYWGDSIYIVFSDGSTTTLDSYHLPEEYLDKEVIYASSVILNGMKDLDAEKMNCLYSIPEVKLRHSIAMIENELKIISMILKDVISREDETKEDDKCHTMKFNTVLDLANYLNIMTDQVINSCEYYKKE